MRIPRSPLLLLTLSAAVLAAPPEFCLQADPPIQLAGYSTYRWASAAPAADSMLSERARRAVARGFGARGLAGSARGDIAVAVSLHAQMDRGARRASYAEGQLAIDIYDALSQRLVWRGLAAGHVDPASDSDIGRMVSALLAHASL